MVWPDHSIETYAEILSRINLRTLYFHTAYSRYLLDKSDNHRRSELAAWTSFGPVLTFLKF
jgi:hypothetical protein